MFIEMDYTDLKSLVTSKGLLWQYVEATEQYNAFVIDGTVTYKTTLYKSGFEPINCTSCAADTSDFVTNIIPIANKKDKNLAEQNLPPNTTRVIENYQDLIDGSFDNVYTIPNGQTLTIQRLACASSLSLGAVVSSKAELFEDVAGDGVTLNLVTPLYTSGQMIDMFVNESYVGDGSRAIRTRRESLDSGAREIYTRWEGYLV